MKQKSKTKLIPPDLQRCQAERKSGSFMTIGPRPYIRCEAAPTVVAVEKAPGADGQIGAMSLCEEHRKIFEQLFPGKATFSSIKVKRIVTRQKP